MAGEQVRGNVNPDTVVVWLHGLGDTPMGWADMAEEMSSEMRWTKWRLPCAPEQPVTCNGGMPCTSWMDLIEIPIRVGSPDNGLHIEASIAAVHRIIDEEVENGIDAKRIILGGFSQGGALALCSAVKYPKPLGGCCVLSGWAPPAQKLGSILSKPENQTSASRTPYLICHGDDDQVVEFRNAVHVKELLQKSGQEVEFHKYRGMGHSSCAQEQCHILGFITKHNPAAATAPAPAPTEA